MSDTHDRDDVQAGPSPTDWAYPADWAFFAPPPSTAPPRATPWRRFPAAAAAGLLLVVAAIGFGAGHLAWPVSTSPTAASGVQGAGGSTGPVDPFGGGPGFGGRFFGQTPPGGSSSGAVPEGSGGPADVSAIAAKVAPGLVDVNSTFGYQQAEGAGTGIVLTSSGEVLTNNHVINGATKITVTDVGNGRTYSARVVGYDRSQDIAVLRLSGASGLTTAKLGNSSKISLGQAIVAIGNAGGSGGSPTSAGGSITALNQSIDAGDELDGTVEQLTGLIQVNADVQSGDSGGSLVDTTGAVIGMDTAATAQFAFDNASGQGYAIPINEAVAVARQIESGLGSDTVHVGDTAFLGLLIQPSGSGSPNSSSGGGFGNGGGFGGSPGPGRGSPGPSGGASVQGADVSGVVSGGSAARAGIVGGDVITSLGGRPVTSSSSLSALMVAHHPGDKVSIGWVDSSGATHTATVTLGSGPPS